MTDVFAITSREDVELMKSSIKWILGSSSAIKPLNPYVESSYSSN